jgi:D-sedoheptulose 7-phosphate isomerase
MTATPRLSEFVDAYLARLKFAVDKIPVDRVEAIGDTLYTAYRHDKSVFVIGNGGSAATASHMACDLGKNTIAVHRRRFRILSLTDNVALMSALGNDLGYEHIFSEQLTNLIRPGDVLITISASGNSPNILRAMEYARSRAATNVALLGFDGGRAAEIADTHVLVPVPDYGIVEDIHLVIDHILTEYFRARLDLEEALVR